MFKSQPTCAAVRGCLVVAFLVFVAACIPGTNRVAAAPANLVAIGGVGRITLTWESSLGATGYSVKRSVTSGGPFVALASTSSATYVDSTAADGSEYFYVVSSLAPDGESADSAQTSASTIVIPSRPVDVVAVGGDAQVTLSWSESSGTASYSVKRATLHGGPYQEVGTTASTSHVDPQLTNGATYYYVISAVNEAGESADSVQVSASPNVRNPPPSTFGTWINVTPSGVDLTSELCSNFGASTMQSDPANPAILYTLFHCQGVWKSTDFGATWVGPINTGTNGSAMANCSGGLTVAPGTTPAVPTIYVACIRGTAEGFWRSVDGGVSWTHHVVGVTTVQRYFPPVVNPYDKDHLLMRGHEFQSIVQSFDGGLTWSSLPVNPAMLQGGFTSPSIFFIDTGNALTTRGTWLWIGDQAGGAYGTWRTSNHGADWSRVDSNEQVGYAQIYQPDTSGVVYMAGAYSAHGWGVLRSSDYGLTWSHVGADGARSAVFGTSKNVYSTFGIPVGPGGTVDPGFQVASQPGTGDWVSPGTPPDLAQGPAQVRVVNNGSNNILVGAMLNSGIWRYVEP